MPWFREWVTIEQEATALRSFEPLVVPGLLQTEGYARALYGGASQLVGDEMEQQVAARVARQAVLDRTAPPQLVRSIAIGLGATAEMMLALLMLAEVLVGAAAFALINHMG